MNLCFVYETFQQLKVCEVVFSWIVKLVMHISVIGGITGYIVVLGYIDYVGLDTYREWKKI
jgi:hypothetical protein